MKEAEFKRRVEEWTYYIGWELVTWIRINGILCFIVKYPHKDSHFLPGLQELQGFKSDFEQHRWIYLNANKDGGKVARGYDAMYCNSIRDSIRKLKAALKDEKRKPIRFE